MAEENNQVQLNDVAIAVNAIDIASKSGAFNGADMEIIGGARNRLHGLVQAAQPAPAAANGDANGLQDEVGVVDDAEVIVEEK